MLLAQLNPTANPTEGMAGLFPMPPDKLLTYQDVASMMNCSTKSIQRWGRHMRKFRPTKTTVRFLESDIQRFIKENLYTEPEEPDSKLDTLKPKLGGRSVRPSAVKTGRNRTQVRHE